MALGRINVLGWVLAHYLGCEAWPGGKITCVYGLTPGIYNWAEAGPIREMYQGGQRVHVIRAVGKDVGLGTNVG